MSKSKFFSFKNSKLFTLIAFFSAVLALVACGGDGSPSQTENNSGNEHTHIWGNWIATTPATCTASGVSTRICSSCGETETETIPQLTTSQCSSGGDVVYGSLDDSRDGKSYRTVTIGAQTWMAENLNHVTDSSWCYDDDPANCVIYGRLYAWNAAMSACPFGWRLPTNGEWNDLIEFVGSGAVAGRRLKSETGWENNGNGTNDYGWSALPGGERLIGGIGLIATWWSSTESNLYALRRIMGWSTDDVPTATLAFKGFGFSVRCVLE